MPDGFVFAQAFFASMGVSVLVLLTPFALLRLTRSTPSLHNHSTVFSVPGSIAAGVIVGCHVLQFPWTWPPANAIERFLQLFVPGTLIVHLAVSLWSHTAGTIRLLRLLPSLACPLLILYGSVHLRAPLSVADHSLPGTVAAPLIIGSCTITLLAAVFTTQSLTRRTSPLITGLLITLTLPAAGISIMLAGYIKGGSAALPLAGSLLATVLGLRFLPHEPRRHALPDLALLLLFGLLMIGHFFGRISLLQAASLLGSPLLAAAIPLPQKFRSRHTGELRLRLLILAVLIAAQLALAAWEFSVRMKPLLA